MYAVRPALPNKIELFHFIPGIKGDRVVAFWLLKTLKWVQSRTPRSVPPIWSFGVRPDGSELIPSIQELHDVLGVATKLRIQYEQEERVSRHADVLHSHHTGVSVQDGDS